MKFSLRHVTLVGAITSLSLFANPSSALKCGIKGVTEPCIGDTDDRYNPDVGYDLKDQDDLWENLEGLYVFDICNYDENKTAITNGYLDTFPEEAGWGSYDFCSVKAFTNLTVSGSRYYIQRYTVAKFNNDGANSIPLPGLIIPVEGFSTSTFEKNGESLQLGASLGFLGPDIPFVVDETPALLTPVGGKAMIALGDSSVSDIYESTYCVDPSCRKLNMYGETYVYPPDGSDVYVSGFNRMEGTKVDKATWLEEWSKTFTDYNVPPPAADANPFFSQPFNPATGEIPPECITLNCPTEEDWKLRDPYLGTSPYVEPDGVLTGGFIAGVTIGSIVVAVVIFYFIYKHGVEAREQRVKAAVLKSIAQSMSITTHKEMTSDDLGKMFKKIDADGNGNLSKVEVKGLVDEAGVANMSDRDYDVFFNCIDLDGNGTLDFAEFCAFFASISVSENRNDSFAEA